jgi:predicted nucleic acid-binding protein
MDILVDTGVLLRLVIPTDPLNADIRQAIKILRTRGERLIMLTQNAAEFWNVCTRPATTRGGYGFSIEETARQLRLIERLISVRQESEAAYQEWKRLVVVHSVKGTKVHDARIVAAMKTHGITHVLTLNGDDFRRFAPLVTVIRTRRGNLISDIARGSAVADSIRKPVE